MSSLLTSGISSPKLAKYTGDNYVSAILYLASGTYIASLCPNMGNCGKTCLITKAGRGAFDDKVSAARKRKSDEYLTDPVAFKARIVREIERLVIKGQKRGKAVAVRLNGGSDLDWTDVYAKFPTVTFWEYTKRPELALKLSLIPNVNVTYSFSERTTPRILRAMLDRRINVAMVFDVKRGKPLPAMVDGVPVTDGDLHDFRFLDQRGVIVGLRLKSNRRPTTEQKSGGFVQQVSGQLLVTAA